MNKEIIDKIILSKKNVIINGDPLVGKTIDCIFPLIDKVLEYKENILIVDSKEEYISKYSLHLKNNGYNTVIINLRDIHRSSNWNPLDYPYTLFKEGKKDESLQLIEKLASTIFDNGEIDDKFWEKSASDLFIGIVLSLFEDASPSEINFNSIYSVLMSSSKKCGTSDYFTKYFETKDNTSTSYVYVASTVLAPRDTKLSIIALALQKIRAYISRDIISKLISRTSFDMSKLFTEPSAVFVLTKSENNSLNNIALLFLEQLLTAINFTNDINYNVVLDNLESNNEKYYHFAELIRLDFDNKLKFFIGTRDIDYLEDKIGLHFKEDSNLIDVNEESITISVGNEKFELPNDYDHMIFIKDVNEYPILKDKYINIFNVEGYVNYKIHKQVNDIKYDALENKKEIDELLTAIDKRIFELENKERVLDNDTINDLIHEIDVKLLDLDFQEKNLTSDFTKFKINTEDEEV